VCAWGRLRESANADDQLGLRIGQFPDAGSSRTGVRRPLPEPGDRLIAKNA